MNNKAIFFVAILLVIAAFLTGRASTQLAIVKRDQAGSQGTGGTNKVAAASPSTNKPQVLGASDAKDFADGGIAIKGNKDAKVTVVEISDPSCPYCGAAAGGNQQVIDSLKQQDPTYQPAVPAIEKDYVDSGKVRLVYRYYPGHGTGETAMQALYCAVDEGKFWEYQEKLFQNQDKVGDLEAVLNFGAEVGLNKDTLRQCVESGKYKDQIQKDVADVQATLQKMQITRFGTPAFFINGNYVGGAVSYPVIKAIIDQELAK